ncbi:unnamed protein product [Schistosoma mansoni]|uniref:Smp_205030 n=1 Tax=Schistosoma mansoni TaxID=6183 RepID=UPI00022C8432|nr:unnamed protein product [Schistosoma mansoni]|eukprot:XP_018644679.1 unnamed protein product [Schistosoma mansoni]
MFSIPLMSIHPIGTQQSSFATFSTTIETKLQQFLFHDDPYFNVYTQIKYSTPHYQPISNDYVHFIYSFICMTECCIIHYL